MFKESLSRSFIKMLSWRVWATLTTIALVFIFVGKMSIAVTVGAFEVVSKMVLYFIHERIWDKIPIGRRMTRPFILWFTGLPGSGKTTLANKVYEYLKGKRVFVERLDGDKVRAVFPHTGFSKDDRDNHVRRIGFLSSMLERNGVIVVASFISPYAESRRFIRQTCSNFIEVYVSTSLEECERRDVKGLYKKARAGEINHFTGVDDPYEVPESPEIIIDTENETVQESFDKIKGYIKQYL